MAYRPSSLEEAQNLAREATRPMRTARAVPNRAGEARQVPMFRTQEKWGVGYYLPYNDVDTPDNWQGNEVIEPSAVDRKPVNARSAFAGTDTFWQHGTEEHRVRRAQQDHPYLRYSLEKEEGMLGHEVPPHVPNPKLRWQDLRQERVPGAYPGEEDVNWYTPQGSKIANANMETDDLGPLVKTAEISPDYQGRRWSREMMGDLAETYSPWGIIHSDGFTFEGMKAFQDKGVKDDIDLMQDSPIMDEGEGSPAYNKWYAQQMDDQRRLIDGLMTSLGRRRPGDSHGPRYTQDRMDL